ncbi:hypothetical protein SK128_021526 [Halocaridina rubra]|uniref:Saposin B-type domain-containing protein n=1 Tax=Halocaridina rubra TaxID=373956 RepID=A0AAN9A2C0_HALRR
MEKRGFLVLLLLLILGSQSLCQESKLSRLLEELHLDDTSTQLQLLKFVRRDEISESLECLMNNGGPGCDPRTPQIRSVLQELATTGYVCGVCSRSVQRAIDAVVRSIRRKVTSEECHSLESTLQLSTPLCT